MEHTPVPWKVKEIDSATIVDEHGNTVAHAWMNTEAMTPLCIASNARFIVQSCNAHSELVTALEKVKKQLVYVNTVLKEEGGNMMIMGIRNAIVQINDALTKVSAPAGGK